MWLTDLLNDPTAPRLDVQRVVDDSRLLGTDDKANTLFVLDTRNHPHAADFITEAQQYAAAVVSNIQQPGVLYHPAPGQVLGRWARHLYPRQPAHVVAVTGTNGKTSVAWYYQQLCQAAGHKAACMGTLGVYVNGEKTRETGYTSPTPVVTHETLDDLAAAGVTHVCLEASSHALALHRLDAVDITAAALTNITQDHLDFHGTMDAYHAAKARLFTDCLPPEGVTVLPSQRMEAWPLMAAAKADDRDIITFGSGQAALTLSPVAATADGQTLTLKLSDVKKEITVPLLGTFQAENLGAAIGLALASGLSLTDILPHLPHLHPVPGRMETLPRSPAQPAVVIDYAHTPDALEQVLTTLRPLVPTDGKLWCVFGCGGNRDTAKRPLMGKIVADLADVSLITDDNPRHEDPAIIRADIQQGVPHEHTIGDRTEAIAYALQHANPHDIVLLAGKGHETGQIIGDTTHPFSDKDTAQHILQNTTPATGT